MSKSREVVVLDSKKKFLEYTTPANARWLLKIKKAEVFSVQPFTIILNYSVSVSSIRRETQMQAVRNFTNYFKDERDVFVQNIANAQVSCEFPIDNGQVEGFLFPPSKDPVNLTQHIPFESIKKSMDFRKMLSRRPPVLILLDFDEYKTYFAKKAKSLNLKDAEGNPNIDAAIDVSEDNRLRRANRNTRDYVTDEKPSPIHKVVERGSGPGGIPMELGERQRVESFDGGVTEDEIINPRVLHLCNQVKAEIEEDERMPAIELLESLQGIPNLKIDDYEYIRAHAFYKTVKKWARQQSQEIATTHEDEDG